MVKAGAGPGGRAVASGTTGIGLNMRCWLARRLPSIVATLASLADATMVEAADRPLPRRMASVALRLGIDMIGGFASGPHCVVAG